MKGLYSEGTVVGYNRMVVLVQEQVQERRQFASLSHCHARSRVAPNVIAREIFLSILQRPTHSTQILRLASRAIIFVGVVVHGLAGNDSLIPHPIPALPFHWLVSIPSV